MEAQLTFPLRVFSSDLLTRKLIWHYDRLSGTESHKWKYVHIRTVWRIALSLRHGTTYSRTHGLFLVITYNKYDLSLPQPDGWWCPRLWHGVVWYCVPTFRRTNSVHHKVTNEVEALHSFRSVCSHPPAHTASSSNMKPLHPICEEKKSLKTFVMQQ